MGVNKVVYGGKTLVDLTNDSVTPETLAEGVTAHGANGEPIVGTMRNSEDLNAVLTEQEALIAELQDILAKKAVSGGGSYNFEWARGYEIEIGANSIKNSTDTVAYIKTLVDSYSTSLIILMSPLTVNNQLVLCGVSGVTRCSDGKIVNTAVGTAYDMFIPEGTKYLVLEKQG